MAWLKTYTLPNTTHSFEAYWEVIGIVYQHQAQLSELKIGCWSSAEDYEAKMQPIYVKTYLIPSGLAPELAVGALQFVTGYALTQPEFQGAQVVAA